MATKEEVQKLAALARIRVEDAELEKFTQEFDAILAYVGQLEKLDLSVEEGAQREGNVGSGTLRNVMRADGEPHAGGAYTEKLAEQFSAREGDALSVKQIITHE
ncbi:MAG: Asp-tRNA(Asn)/Glu-tRNA(Gln) amidotransferase subunit GatC [Candidatus Paceibacterota bacterium]|jgi:aspartyl/glutamyl-tRNA(Asn/Gln) amidotransferase C subunit